jgi:hypothetical protein
VVVIPGAVYRITVMSKIEAIGSKAADSSDWNHAWSVVAQLAAARGATLGELRPDDGGTPAPAPTGEARTRTDSAADLAAPFAAVAPDQLARDMAEIERAAAALRRAEPTLERHVPYSPSGFEAPAARSVWPLLCVVWLTAAAVVSGAVGAITLLFN